MAELSKFQTKIAQSDRATSRRDSIIPSRRNLEAPQRRAANDIRSGTRGDVGGADALLDMAAQFNRTGSALANRSELLAKQQDMEDRAQAGLDAESGNIDPVRLRKSLSYKDQIDRKNAETAWLLSSKDLQSKINAQIVSDTDSNPEVRERRLFETVDQHFKEFITNEDGSMKDFGSPGAKAYLAEQLGAARSEIYSKGYDLIEKRMAVESLEASGKAYQASVEAGAPVPFETFMSELLPTVDRRLAKEQYVGLTKQAATDMYADAADLMEAGDIEGATALTIKGRDLLRSLRNSTIAGSTIKPVDVPASEVAQGKPEAAPVVKMSHKGNAGVVTEGLRSSGMSDAVIAGFLGNFHHESAVGANKGVGDGGTAFGLAQWRKERVTNFQRVIGKSPQNASIADQVKFVAWEMKNPEAAGMTVKQRDAILAAKTPEQAAELIDKHYERSDGKSRRDRASKAREFFGNSSGGGGEVSGPEVDRSVLDPETIEDKLRTTPTSGAALEPKGAYSLTPTERFELKALERQLGQQAAKVEQAVTNQRQSVEANSFLLRLHGDGAYPSVTELQKARDEGKISVRDYVELTDRIERDQDEDEVEARQAANELKSDQDEAKEDRVTNRIGSLQFRLGTGALRPTDAYGEVLRESNKIEDPAERATYVNTAQAVINDVKGLRVNSPQYKQVATTMTGWRKQYMKDLTDAKNADGVGLSSKAVAKRMESIDAYMGAFITELNKGEMTPDEAEAFLKRVEARTDAYVLRLIGQRPTAAKK
jgi:hypothetical protein